MSKPESLNKSLAKSLEGVVGFFDDPQSLLVATEKVKNAKFSRFDTFTPYPVHGLEHAQGLKRSPLPYVTFVAGLTGTILGFSLQYITSAVAWPINVGGKPLNSWPASVPVIFELTVLLAALTTVGAMFFLNGLPNTKKKAIDPSLTNNRFAILIEPEPEPCSLFGEMDEEELSQKRNARDQKLKIEGYKLFNEAEAQAFLRSVGAKDVRSVVSEAWF